MNHETAESVRLLARTCDSLSDKGVGEMIPQIIGDGEMIPKIIHYVWVGSAVPERYKPFIDSWRKTNPNYEIMLWNEDNIDFSVPIIGQLYKTKKFNKVSDIVRHIAIAEKGGIYLDTDCMVYRSFDRLLDNRCFYGFQIAKHPTDWIGTAVFGAEPGHWFVKKVLDRMLSSKTTWYGLDIPTALGPKLITSMLKAEGLSSYSDKGVKVKDILVCPTSWLYPFWMDEEYDQSCIGDETLMAHFWEGTWKENLPAATRFAQRVRSTIRHWRE